jgi:NAD(P)-dependent dehydrogenase (short-subunit alcohol dehydrogenase family)
MMSDAKVAIITGAASGMGLEVARLLAKQNRWALHLFDLNEKAGAEAATELSATFYKVDISSYESLANAFDAVFQTTKRLDFVFANAGVFEWSSFWEVHGSAGPPPEMPWSVVDVNLKGTMNTCYLAQHYFRQDGRKNGSLVLTASCTALVRTQRSQYY